MELKDVKFDGWPHIIDTRQFSRDWIENILFPLADQEERRFLVRDRSTPFAGKEMYSLFDGESLRTRARFEIAMRRGGGRVILGSEAISQFSSLAKGEPFQDMITVLNEFGGDVIVLRCKDEGGAAQAAAVSDIPIINAGDGPGQHPTQAFLDLYAIKKHRGQIGGISVAMVGDPLNSRTIHSDVYLLARYPNITIYFVSPDHLRIRPDIKDHLQKHHVKFEELRDLREIAHLVDVYYQTRTQTNLGTKPWDRRDTNHGYTVIDRSVLNLAKPDAIILHPLPCVDEIVRSEVDSDPRAVYIKTKNGKMSQVRGGLYISSALLRILLFNSVA